MIEARIPYSFTRSLGVNLSWAEVLDGIDRCLLTCDFTRDKASDELNESSTQLLIDLAISDPGEPMRCKVAQLASLEDTAPNTSRLLYVLVSYLRKHEQQTRRILDLVEEIYADFDYPSCLAKAVRYMPLEGPDLGSLEANESRLLANLDNYLATPPDSPP